jgi:hypothetical protein
MKSFRSYHCHTSKRWISALILFVFCTQTGFSATKTVKHKTAKAIESILYENGTKTEEEGGEVKTIRALKRHEDETLVDKKYLIMYFGAYWSERSRNFTSQMVKWYERHKTDAFEVIYVSSDIKKSNDMVEHVKDVPFPALQSSDKRKGGINAMEGKYVPWLVLVDRKGQVVKKGAGEVMLPYLTEFFNKSNKEN